MTSFVTWRYISFIITGAQSRFYINIILSSRLIKKSFVYKRVDQRSRDLKIPYPIFPDYVKYAIPKLGWVCEFQFLLINRNYSELNYYGLWGIYRKLTRGSFALSHTHNSVHERTKQPSLNLKQPGNKPFLRFSCHFYG